MFFFALSFFFSFTLFYFFFSSYIFIFFFFFSPYFLFLISQPQPMERLGIVGISRQDGPIGGFGLGQAPGCVQRLRGLQRH